MTHQRNAEATSFPATLVALVVHEHGAILRCLAGGPARFGDLLDALPRLDDVLVGGGLRELDAEGLVERRVDPGPPLRVLYELTSAGAELAPILVALKRWTESR